VTSRSIRIGTLLTMLLGSSASAQQAPRPSPSGVQQRSPTRTSEPSWVSSLPSDSQSLYFRGMADSPSEAKAQEDSRRNAIEQAANTLAASFFEGQQTSQSSIDLQTIREYVGKVARVTATYATRAPDGKAYRAHTLLQLSKAFAEPYTIRQFAAPRAQPQQGDAQGSLTLLTNLGPAGTKVDRVQVRAAKDKTGNFTFIFTFSRYGQTLHVRLDEIAVTDDGSAGSTRWRFDVLVGSTLAFTVREVAYDDNVRNYRLQSKERLEADVPASNATTVEIKVIGYRAAVSAATNRQ
jgi:hypothetical protein